MESILQSSLLADAVAEEQRRAQLRPRRRSAGSDCPPHKPAEPTATSAAELRLKEQALRDREKTLKEREKRLERKTFTSSPFCATRTHIWSGLNRTVTWQSDSMLSTTWKTQSLYVCMFISVICNFYFFHFRKRAGALCS